MASLVDQSLQTYALELGYRRHEETLLSFCQEMLSPRVLVGSQTTEIGPVDAPLALHVTAFG